MTPRAPQRDEDEPSGQPSDARSPLRRRLLIGGAAVVVAVAIALAPGLRPEPEAASGPGETLQRALDGDGSTEAQPPTFETVQQLAAQLNEAAGDQPIEAEMLDSVVTSPGPFQSLGELSIPAIGLDVELGNGVDPVTLERGPGHWTGTPMPGQVGNAVVSGHRTTHTAPFRELDELAEGDEIVVESTAGSSTTFTVTEVLVVPVEDYTSVVLAQPEDPDARELTLFACHPEGSLTHRIVVHAIASSS
jgi:sortase A